MDSQKLQTSQANALVYTTLVGFGFVGIYAGYRVKGKTDFLSGLRTQSGESRDGRLIRLSADIQRFSAAFPLALNWFASS